MASALSFMKAVYYLNYRNAGWTETFWLNQSSYATALPVANKLAQFRRFLLARGVSIEWGRVSFLGLPREAKALDVLPMTHHPLRDPAPGGTADAEQSPSDPFTGFMYRLETATGQSANRLFRGIPDGAINDYRLTQAPIQAMADNQPEFDPGSPNLTLLGGIQAFLRFLKNNTVHVKKNGNQTGDNAYTVTAWDRIVFRKIGKHDTGRPFGQCRGRRRKKVVTPS